MNKIKSLPNRPLTEKESYVLAKNPGFAPVSFLNKIPDDKDVPFSEILEKGQDDILDEYGIELCYGFLSVTSENAIAVAFSEKHDEWERVVIQSKSSYDIDEMENEMYQFITENRI
jgi:hypothetical protein